MPLVELSFAKLDDIVLAVERGKTVEIGFSPRAIGPLFEYQFQTKGRLLPTLGSCPLIDQFHGTLRTTSHVKSTSLRPHAVEFSRIPRLKGLLTADLHWTAFTMRLRLAAQASGFPKSIGAGIAGAFSELVENIFLHSRRPKSGLVGYRHEAGEFEFVVADAGEGVLQSLRRNPEYAGICDSGTALRMAINGHSRFGTGHGYGFRPLFLTLASLHGEIRFRSGDHALELEGEGISVGKARIRQRGAYEGLLVSVICRSRQP